MTDVSVQMIERASGCDIYTTHVLMDKWFTNPKMIYHAKALDLDVIGMAKNAKAKYLYNGRLYRLADLYGKSTREYSNGTIISSKRLRLVLRTSRKNRFCSE